MLDTTTKLSQTHESPIYQLPLSHRHKPNALLIGAIEVLISAVKTEKSKKRASGSKYVSNLDARSPDENQHIGRKEGMLTVK